MDCPCLPLPAEITQARLLRKIHDGSNSPCGCDPFQGRHWKEQCEMDLLPWMNIVADRSKKMIIYASNRSQSLTITGRDMAR